MNDTLSDSRHDSKGDETYEEAMEDVRLHNDLTDKNFEEMLGDEEDLGHQFSEEDLKHFASELGLDSLFEDDRNEYKVGK